MSKWGIKINGLREEGNGDVIRGKGKGTMLIDES